MNCPTADKLSQYVDHLLMQEEHTVLERHVESCHDCQRVVVSYEEEQQFIKKTLQTPSLPDDFTTKLLDELQPYEQKAFLHKKSTWKRMSLIVAGIILAFGLGMTFNSSFAQWVGGLFATDQVDEGLRLAATQDRLVERVNLEVADQGITFKVEDIVADSSRVAFSYQILNKNGKPLHTDFYRSDANNNIYVLDANGNKLDLMSSVGWQEDSAYGLIEFSLREHEELDELIAKFDLVELNGKQGNWELEIPIHLKENLKYTFTLPLDDFKTNSHGVSVEMNEVRFAPSSNELTYETRFTDEERVQHEAKIEILEERYGADIVNSFTNYGTAIQYHIENERAEHVYEHKTFSEGNVYDVNLLQGYAQPLDRIGHTAWNESFIPQPNDEKLTFVLDGVFKTVPAGFSIKIKPQELKTEPVTFEYAGHVMTIKKAKKKNQFTLRKSIVPIERETVFTIKMEGGKEGPATELGSWVIVDELGKPYMTYENKSMLNEKDKHGRYKTTIELTAYDINKVPEEITLHLLSVTRYYEMKEKWKFPLYE